MLPDGSHSNKSLGRQESKQMYTNQGLDYSAGSRACEVGKVLKFALDHSTWLVFAVSSLIGNPQLARKSLKPDSLWIPTQQLAHQPQASVPAKDLMLP